MSPSKSSKKGNTVLMDHAHCYRIWGQEGQNTDSYKKKNIIQALEDALGWGLVQLSAGAPATTDRHRQVLGGSVLAFWCPPAARSMHSARGCGAAQPLPVSQGQSGRGHQGPDSGIPVRGSSL